MMNYTHNIENISQIKQTKMYLEIFMKFCGTILGKNLHHFMVDVIIHEYLNKK